MIERGDFERGGKSSGKNVEVTVFVIDDAGQIIEVFFFFVFVSSSLRHSSTLIS